MAVTIEGCVTLIPCDGVSMTIKQRLLEANIPGWQALVGTRIQLNGIFGAGVWYVDSVIDSNNPEFGIDCMMSALAPALASITIVGPGVCGQEITSTNCCAILTSCVTGQTINVALGAQSSSEYTNWETVVDHIIEINDAQYPGAWHVDGICCMNASVDPCGDPSACALGGLPISFNLVIDGGEGTCGFNVYSLTNCQTKQVVYTGSSLHEYLGSVITVQELAGCWSVELGSSEILTDVTLIEGYDDCLCCTGPEPVKYTRVIPKPDRHFYQITQSQCDINGNIKFAEGYYRLFKTLKYGIANTCDNIDLDKLWIKKSLSDLAVINDPTACTPVTPVPPIVCPDPS